TNIFSAAVSGAGIANLITMYGTLTPAFANTFESRHFEVSQERMNVPPWKDIEGYLRNSAIPNIENMQTPLLVEVGDADRNVNWRQSIEMYNAARRAKKELVMLVYANEGHGLRQKKNRMDYQKRILEWFGHYLKGDPAKPWIKQNLEYSEQQDLLKQRKLE
ncbi:MAG: prolyl oligopeptidase family serine peptidase, partial [Pyrinomonadaceae bacterium]|nr:prolyl oligopeptidase family serine peptidase [Pyrinomonadaceae bacterium]